MICGFVLETNGVTIKYKTRFGSGWLEQDIFVPMDQCEELTKFIEQGKAYWKRKMNEANETEKSQ